MTATPEKTLTSTLLYTVGWSIFEASRRIGVSESTVASWVNGRRKTPVPVTEWLTKMSVAMAGVGACPKDWSQTGEPPA